MCTHWDPNVCTVSCDLTCKEQAWRWLFNFETSPDLFHGDATVRQWRSKAPADTTDRGSPKHTKYYNLPGFFSDVMPFTWQNAIFCIPATRSVSKNIIRCLEHGIAQGLRPGNLRYWLCSVSTTTSLRRAWHKHSSSGQTSQHILWYLLLEQQYLKQAVISDCSDVTCLFNSNILDSNQGR
jgi:hypothetical protein